MVFFYPSWRKCCQRTIQVRRQIRLRQLASIDEDAPFAYLNDFPRQAYYALYIAFVGITRKPENNDIAAFEMAPAYAFNIIIYQLIDQQSFAIMQYRQHRSAFDNNRLDNEYSD